MTSPVTRAGLVAAIGCLALFSPYLQWATAVLFGAIAITAIVIPREWALFGYLARPGDYEVGQLRGIAGFALATTALAILGTVPAFGIPLIIFVITVLVVAIGNLGETIARTVWNTNAVGATAFIGSGTSGALLGWGLLTYSLAVEPTLGLATALYFITLGALLGALCRTDFYRRDDPVVLITVGVILWLLSAIMGEPRFEIVLIAFGVTVALGGLAYVLNTASVAGMLSGIIVGYVTVVLAGFTWFVVLLAFFGVGGLATKYRYEEKLRRGVAEDRRGARGTGNVLGNSLVAVLAVAAYVVAPSSAWLTEPMAALAFSGAVGTALADTLSSEIGSLEDRPRLITSFEPVDAGTDGAVTLQGSIAGGVGAGFVAVLSYALLPEIGSIGAVLVFFAGVGGMIADSVLGATLEGEFMGNQGVNLLATVVGAILASGSILLLSPILYNQYIVGVI